MKVRRVLAALILGACLLPGRAQACETGEYVRLHVVASSDSAQDQALKLWVRDGVRAVSAALLRDCGSADAAWETVQENLPLLEGTARLFARAGGFSGKVQAQAGESEFPDRVYAGELVPAGTYRAVRVVLGEGEGHNWWCVLYPSLCVDTETPPVFYSAIGRWMRGVFQEVSGWLAGK